MAGNGITVKSSGSAEPALDFVAEAFQATAGHAVTVAYSVNLDTYDVLVASRDAVERKFRPTGAVEGGGVVIGSVSLGVAVRQGAVISDIFSLSALKVTVLEADRLIITENHTSGLYVESMLKKIGLYEKVAGKIERLPNGPRLLDRLLAGQRRELAFLSLNAIRTYQDKGIVLVGPLPPEVQLTREFMAVPSTASTNKDVARLFVDFCGGPGKLLFEAHGFG